MLLYHFTLLIKELRDLRNFGVETSRLAQTCIGTIKASMQNLGSIAQSLPLAPSPSSLPHISMQTQWGGYFAWEIEIADLTLASTKFPGLGARGRV